MKRFIKDPDSVLDYVFDWSAWLTIEDNDTISAHPIDADTGITVDSSSTTTTATTVWLSGGTAGTSYVVRCEIVTSGGRTIERSAVIDVRER